MTALYGYRTVPADCKTTIGRAKSSAFVIPPQSRLRRWKRLATPAVLRVFVPRSAEMPSPPFVYRLVASGARVSNLLESATCDSVGRKCGKGEKKNRRANQRFSPLQTQLPTSSSLPCLRSSPLPRWTDERAQCWLPLGFGDGAMTAVNRDISNRLQQGSTGVLQVRG